MVTKEERLDLLKFAMLEMGDDKMSLVVKDNVVTAMCTTNGKCTLHEIGFHKPFWSTW
jgi:hypothetical protein